MINLEIVLRHVTADGVDDSADDLDSKYQQGISEYLVLEGSDHSLL